MSMFVKYLTRPCDFDDLLTNKKKITKGKGNVRRHILDEIKPDLL